MKIGKTIYSLTVTTTFIISILLSGLVSAEEAKSGDKAVKVEMKKSRLKKLNKEKFKELKQKMSQKGKKGKRGPRLGPVAREQRKHIIRTVKLARMEEIAKAKGKDEVLKKIDIIRKNEAERHKKALARIRAGKRIKKQGMKGHGMKKPGMKKPDKKAEGGK